jgi:hypothetical protein
MAGDFDLSDDDFLADLRPPRCPRCGAEPPREPLDCPERDPQPARLGRAEK